MPWYDLWFIGFKVGFGRFRGPRLDQVMRWIDDLMCELHTWSLKLGINTEKMVKWRHWIMSLKKIDQPIWLDSELCKHLEDEFRCSLFGKWYYRSSWLFVSHGSTLEIAPVLDSSAVAAFAGCRSAAPIAPWLVWWGCKWIWVCWSSGSLEYSKNTPVCLRDNPQKLTDIQQSYLMVLR